MKTGKKIDLRVLRTRTMIMQAFMELVHEKGYEAVTIQNIADKAMINRATFYAHYKDKQDLYDQVIEYIMDSFSSILDATTLYNGNKIQLQQLQQGLTQIFEEIRKNKKAFIALTEGSSNRIFRKRLQELLLVKYEDLFKQLKITENEIEVPLDFIIEYMTSIFIATVHWWVNSDSTFPPEHMARLVIRLIGNGHLTVLGIEIV